MVSGHLTCAHPGFEHPGGSTINNFKVLTQSFAPPGRILRPFNQNFAPPITLTRGASAPKAPTVRACLTQVKSPLLHLKLNFTKTIFYGSSNKNICEHLCFIIFFDNIGLGSIQSNSGILLLNRLGLT